MNAEGVASAYFVPGPYARQEAYAGRFVDWYLAELGARDTPVGGSGRAWRVAGR
jgi:hypothetical protein